MGGGSVNFRILTLVRRTRALIIGNSQSNQEVHKETSTPRRSVWGVVILADEGVTPRLLHVRIPGAYEDRRPAGSFDGPTTGPL